MSRLQRPDSRVISQPSSAAKSATLLVCLMPVESTRALALFYVQAPAASPSSRFSLAANGKARHYRLGFQRLSGLSGCLRFSMSRLQRSAPRVISQPRCVAKNATSQVRLMPVGASRPLTLFFILDRIYKTF